MTAQKRKAEECDEQERKRRRTFFPTKSVAEASEK